MATIAAAAGGLDGAPADLRLTPETYTTIGTLLDHNKDFVIPELVETYGDQGITGFLKLTGAIQGGGTSDEVRYHEVGRRHRLVAVNSSGASGVSGDQMTLNYDAGSNAIGVNDVIMDATDGRRYVVIATSAASPLTSTTATVASLDGETAIDN